MTIYYSNAEVDDDGDGNGDGDGDDNDDNDYETTRIKSIMIRVMRTMIIGVVVMQLFFFILFTHPMYMCNMTL